MDSAAGKLETVQAEELRLLRDVAESARELAAAWPKESDEDGVIIPGVLTKNLADALLILEAFDSRS